MRRFMHINDWILSVIESTNLGHFYCQHFDKYALVSLLILISGVFLQFRSHPNTSWKMMFRILLVIANFDAWLYIFILHRAHYDLIGIHNKCIWKFWTEIDLLKDFHWVTQLVNRKIEYKPPISYILWHVKCWGHQYTKS